MNGARPVRDVTCPGPEVPFDNAQMTRYGIDPSGCPGNDGQNRSLGGAWRLAVYQVDRNDVYGNIPLGRFDRRAINTKYGRIWYLGCVGDSGTDRVASVIIKADDVIPNNRIEYGAWKVRTEDFLNKWGLWTNWGRLRFGGHGSAPRAGGADPCPLRGRLRTPHIPALRRRPSHAARFF